VISPTGDAPVRSTQRFKQTLMLMARVAGQGCGSEPVPHRAQGTDFFRRLSVPILANVSHLGDRPHVKDLIGTVKVMLDAYRAGELDRLLLVNAQFVNTMTQSRP